MMRLRNLAILALLTAFAAGCTGNTTAASRIYVHSAKLNAYAKQCVTNCYWYFRFRRVGAGWETTKVQGPVNNIANTKFYELTGERLWSGTYYEYQVCGKGDGADWACVGPDGTSNTVQKFKTKSTVTGVQNNYGSCGGYSGMWGIFVGPGTAQQACGGAYTDGTGRRIVFLDSHWYYHGTQGVHYDGVDPFYSHVKVWDDTFGVSVNEGYCRFKGFDKVSNGGWGDGVSHDRWCSIYTTAIRGHRYHVSVQTTAKFFSTCLLFCSNDGVKSTPWVNSPAFTA